MSVSIAIPSLGNMFQDYRDPILGDSYNWGPAIDASKVKYFAFHHSVTAQTAFKDGNWKAECDVIAKLHVNGNGWGGVGYRFIIASNGVVAYVGDLSHGGSAVTGNNDTIFSACFVGDFTKQLPTAAQIHSAHLLAKFFLNDMPQYPLLDSWDDVIGHRDAAELLKLPGSTPTTCPSPVWRTGGDTLRDRIINDRFVGYPNPQPTVSLPPVPTPTPTPVPPSVVPKPRVVITDLSTRILVNGKEMELRQINDVMASLSGQVELLNSKLNQQKAENEILSEKAKRDTAMREAVKTIYGV